VCSWNRGLEISNIVMNDVDSSPASAIILSNASALH
jgi:hypothetical protein